MYAAYGFFRSVTGASTFVDINALPGSMENALQNNHHVLRDDMIFLGAYVQCASLTRARLVAPSLQYVAYPEIRPIMAAAAPTSDPNFMDVRWNPILLRGREEIALQISKTGAGAEDVHGVYFIGDRNWSFSPGPIYLLHASGVTVQTADVWSLVTPTYDVTLPAGQYDVVGFEALAATLVCSRIVFPGQWWRPGVVGQITAGGRGYIPFYTGGFGMLGSFTTTALPTFENLSAGADAVQDFWLHCIKRS